MRRRNVEVRYLSSALVSFCVPENRHRYISAVGPLTDSVHDMMGDTSVGHSLQVEYVRVSLEPYGSSVLFAGVWCSISELY